MGETVYSKRQFLNTEEDGGVAFIRASVGEATVNNDGYVSFDAELGLSDCNRQISLDFSVYGQQDSIADEVANLRTKLRRLRSTFAAFDRAVTEQLDFLEGK